MGRTIHYSVETKNSNKLADEQWQQIKRLQEQYNKTHKWTCEQLSLQRFTYYPRLDAWTESELDTSEIWDEINTRLKEPDGLQKLIQENLITCEEGGYRGKGFLMSGFTKVRDCEADAAVVVKFLVEISTIAPTIDIRVSDEGDYLKCPVIVRNGKMSVDIEELQSHLKYLYEMHEEAPENDRRFWGRLIRREESLLEIGEECDNSLFIS